MNKREAMQIAEAELLQRRRLSYAELRSRIIRQEEEHLDIRGASEQAYQVEVQYFWDGAEAGPIRVMVSIDDGGWRAFSPLHVAFIKAADDTFIGE